MTKIYVGLANSSHEPAVAIVDGDGRIVFAEASERYLQNKRAWCSPPDDLIRIGDLIDEYGGEDTDYVVATSWRESFLRRRRLIYLLPLTRYLLRQYLAKTGQPAHQYLSLRTIVGYSDFYAGNNFELLSHIIRPQARVERRSYEHHLTHAAAACYSSPFADAVCAVIDGEGEGVSTTFFHYDRGRLRQLPTRRSKASLGLFYSKMCGVCGFSVLKGEEWKVMGLAPYGQLDEELYSLMRQILRVEKGQLIYGPNWQACEKQIYARARKPGESPLAVADVAFTAQRLFTDLVMEMLAHLHAMKLSDNVVMAGGCALNSACNGKILEQTPFKQSYIFCAPADDGNAVGAALLAYHQDHPGKLTVSEAQSPYLGSQISSLSLERLTEFGVLEGRRFDSRQELYRETAKILAEGKIVGWVQGRAEFGPRALGNRSILADPRSADVKDTLNARVKYREEFRPFAPAILHEHGQEYFEGYCETRYMERALLFKRDVVDKVPGVVHVDGTGRLQTVKRSWNEAFYDLISAFHELTGVPVLLNTSFNVMGKPIIHSAQDAVSVYLFSGMDAMAIGDWLFEKRLHA